MDGLYRAVILFTITMFLLPPRASFSSDADSSDVRRRAELVKRIQDLEKKKVQLKQHALTDSQQNKFRGKSLDEVIARWEKLLDTCGAKKKSLRCADAMYNLGNLYYDKSRDEYIQKREQYQKDITEHDANPQEPEPVNPAPDYLKSLRMYDRLIQEYPDFSKIGEIYYQMANIYLLMDDKERFNAYMQKAKDIGYRYLYRRGY